MTVFLTDPQNIRTVYYHLQGRDLSVSQIAAVQRDGLDPEVADKLPAKFEELDRNGFEFSCDTTEPEGRQWEWQHADYGHSADFDNLAAAVKNAYWHHVDLYQDIYRLSKDGFSVVPFGDPETFYWRYVKSGRVSPLFPTEEGAWRDCKRDDEEVRRKIHDHFRPDEHGAAHRSQGRTFKEAIRDHARLFESIHAMEPMLEEAGFEITDQHWKMRGENCRTVVQGGRSKVIRSALVAWSEANPAQFRASIEALDKVSEPAAFGTDHLEAWLREAGYQVTDGGWNHPDVEHIHLIQGGRSCVVLAAWAHYMRTHARPLTAEESQALQAMTKPVQVWGGDVPPPVGTTVWVTPHNASWGFTSINKVKAKVLGYHDEYVWLRLTQKVGMVQSIFITTRVDKVSFSVCGSEADGQ
ncbi:hypothetical protein HOV23_gp117 [Pseudomonas phage Lana]|uniref:Uncharacterized protein n=1 Tax=Pseudomonas phage Lana TaxID=2530172 RepID=A0A481W5U7_9CAUD|nr:hypothetical protein HOV23_gp117 [Pseudomonas phage Lana]QBJ04456.1 hypothetical protein [Pseudomonas phage Lana]